MLSAIKAVLFNNCTLILFFRDVTSRAPVDQDEAERISMHIHNMLYAKQPKKKKLDPDEFLVQQPKWEMRQAFLLFLLETYKCSINNREPSKSGDQHKINHFISIQIYKYLFGSATSLQYKIKSTTGQTTLQSIAFPSMNSK